MYNINFSKDFIFSKIGFIACGIKILKIVFRYIKVANIKLHRTVSEHKHLNKVTFIKYAKRCFVVKIVERT